MKKFGCIGIGLIGLGGLAFLCLIMFFYLSGKYNQMVTREEATNAAWAQVETVLQRRFDLIPNLVSTVKGFAEQEKEIFTEVTRLRSQWGAAKSTGDKIAAAEQTQGALSRLLLVAENYPQLKSNQNFLSLQAELAGTENRVAVERRRYNESIQAYNQYVRLFPNTLIASVFGFDRKDEYFESDAGAESAPKVSFE